jgi:hypothetical protein
LGCSCGGFSGDARMVAGWNILRKTKIKKKKKKRRRKETHVCGTEEKKRREEKKKGKKIK